MGKKGSSPLNWVFGSSNNSSNYFIPQSNFLENLQKQQDLTKGFYKNLNPIQIPQNLKELGFDRKFTPTRNKATRKPKLKREYNERISRILEKNRTQTNKKNINSKRKQTSNLRIEKLLNSRIQNKKEVNYKSKHRLDIKQTPIDSFQNLEEIFFIKDDRLYTLNDPIPIENSLRKNNISYCRTKLDLEESEQISLLEKEFLNLNKTKIQDYKRKILKELSDKNNTLNRKISSLERSVVEEDFLPKYISEKIIPFCKSVNSNPEIKRSLADLKGEFKSESFSKENETNGERLTNKKSYLNEFLELSNYSKKGEATGLMIFLGNVYKVNTQKIDGEDFTEILNSAEHLFNLTTLTKKYNRHINDELEKKLKSSLNDQLFRLERKRTQISDLEKEVKNNILDEFNEKGNMGYQKIDKDAYVVYKKIPQFIMKRRGDHYLFSGRKIGTLITKNKDKLSIKGHAFIFDSKLPENFKHPFEYGGAYHKSKKLGFVLCYGANSSGGTGFYTPRVNHYQDIADLEKNNFPLQVLSNIEITELIFTRGCRDFRKSTHEASLTPENYRDEYISKRRANSLIKKGIDFYDNDTSSSKGYKFK